MPSQMNSYASPRAAMHPHSFVLSPLLAGVKDPNPPNKALPLLLLLLPLPIVADVDPDEGVASPKRPMLEENGLLSFEVSGILAGAFSILKGLDEDPKGFFNDDDVDDELNGFVLPSDAAPKENFGKFVVVVSDVFRTEVEGPLFTLEAIDALP